MIDGAPRPLPRKRLEQLVHGLRQRLSVSSEKMSAQVSELSTELSTVESQFQQQWTDLQSVQQTQRDSSTTNCDEQLHARWDDAEMRAFKAVFDTAGREGHLRKEARLRVEQLTADVKKRAAEIEQSFLRAKDVPIARLNAFRELARTANDELTFAEQQAEAALAKRSLAAPNVPVAELPVPSPSSSDAAMQALNESLSQARSASQRIANHSLAKFFESQAWWWICGLFFVLVLCGLSLSGMVELIVAILVASVATVSMLLISLVAIRPWLKQFAMAEYPKLQAILKLGRRQHDLAIKLAVIENDHELKRLASKRDERFEQAKQWREQQVQELTKKLENELAVLRAAAELQKSQASEQLTQAVQDSSQEFEQRMQWQQQQFSQQREQLQSVFAATRSKIQSNMDGLRRGGATRLQMATQKAVHIVNRSRRWCHEVFPDWQRLCNSTTDWPDNHTEPILPLGSLSISDVLPEQAKRDAGAAQLHAPLLLSPLRDGYLTITGDPSAAAVTALVRNLVMRTLTTLPAGKVQVWVIDPPGLGRDFGWLMHLSDFDPLLVSHRVWTQPGHIAKQLTSLALAAEDFIQQSLRNQYRDIVEYNAEAGALAEPFRLLVWSSFPSGLDEASWKSLVSLLDSGSRCGIILLLIIDPSLSGSSDNLRAEMRDIVYRHGWHLTFDSASKKFHAQSSSIEQFEITPAGAPSDEQAQQIVREVGRRALLSSRVEVPLESMVPTRSNRWQADSSFALEIPIGQSGVGRVHSLKLGLGTAQHAIIAGKTGSGKSSLLHSIITSAALKYSPESLRLVLLDFKKGVEFQVYSDAGLPHADIIGIESHREFGLSALETIDACMQRRGEAFRKAAVQDLASWNAVHPQHPMPRVLLVIDEFQELFVEDDKLSGQASLILDRIVRQGRSFGVHAVLSSQTLAGSYSLPRTTLGQMSVRIALQCDASDAQIIFSEDNPAAARLKVPGQAIYNDAGGRIEGNQPMQIGWLAKSQQVQWLQELPAGYRNQDATTNRLGRCVVYDGNRSATWDSVNADLAIEQALREVNPDARWCVVGESVSINPAVVFPLTQQAGRNVLIVGPDDAAAAAVLDAVIGSFIKATQVQPPSGSSALHSGETQSAGLPGRPQLFVVQGAKPTDARCLKLTAKWRELDAEVHTTDARGVDDMLAEVHALVQNRIAGELGGQEFPPVLLTLVQLGRLRTLRREDDFSSFGEAKLTPDKLLEEILRDGPSQGVFTIIWAENYSTVNRWLARSALREIEIRLLMQMSSGDSTNLVDSVAASRLGDHVMLVFDEATGQDQKFRPFAVDSLAELPQWTRAVRSPS